MLRSRSGGSIMMFASAVLFSIMAIMVKVLGKSVPAAEIIFIRSFISVLVIIGLFLIGKAKLTFRSKEKLIFRGIVGGISLMLYFYAITITSLSNAVLLAYTYPIFASIFSIMYAKEKLTVGRAVFMSVAFLGLFLILRFDISSLNIGDLMALISGVTSGMAIVSIRDLRKTDSSAAIVLSFVITGSIFSLFFLKGNIMVPSYLNIVLLIIMGILGAIGQLFMTAAYKICSTASGGVISMSGVIMTTAMGFLILGEQLTLSMIIGGLLIFISATFFSLSEQGEIPR